MLGVHHPQIAKLFIAVLTLLNPDHSGSNMLLLSQLHKFTKFVPNVWSTISETKPHHNHSAYVQSAPRWIDLWVPEKEGNKSISCRASVQRFHAQNLSLILVVLQAYQRFLCHKHHTPTWGWLKSINIVILGMVEGIGFTTLLGVMII